ncbi:MAG: hypothetical protein AB7S26_36965 [Sandaracinaceae bacterium]
MERLLCGWLGYPELGRTHGAARDRWTHLAAPGSGPRRGGAQYLPPARGED